MPVPARNICSNHRGRVGPALLVMTSSHVPPATPYDLPAVTLTQHVPAAGKELPSESPFWTETAMATKTRLLR